MHRSSWFVKEGTEYGALQMCPSQMQRPMVSTWQARFRSMQSDNLFPWEDCFDTSMASSSSSVGLPERVLRQLETAIADAQLIDGSSCVFLDVSKSDAFMEQATNVATCIRPTHDIYSHQLGRKLTVPELWCCQGLWRDDFPCPQTIDELLNENPSKAQDLAGLATG